MEFKLGQMIVKIRPYEKDATIIVPIGEHVIAVQIMPFEVSDHNSVSIKGEIYHKDDKSMVKCIQSWIETPEGEE